MRIPLRDGFADTDARTVRRAGQDLRLAPKEAALLERLAAASPEVVERSVLLAEVWGYRPGVDSKTLETTVYTLRMKVETDPRAPAQLQAVPGVGYRWIAVPTNPGPSLLDREAELARLAELVRPGRFVHVHGPAGVGKTALLRAFAARFPGSVHWVELGEEPESALAAALGVPLGPPDSVGRALQSVEGLVVLDHGEMPADWRQVPIRATVIWACRDQSPEAEFELCLGPLALPVRSPASVADLVRAPAGALVWRTATAVWPTIEADPPLQALAGLAHALHGLPGPLLRAAALLATTSAADLLARVADLAAWEDPGRLSPEERTALVALAHWGSPFSLTEAEVLLGPNARVQIDALVRRSLVERLPDRRGASRWRVFSHARATAATLPLEEGVATRIRGLRASLGERLAGISRPDEDLRQDLIDALSALESAAAEDPRIARAAAAARFVVGPWERALAILEQARPTREVLRDRAELLARLGRFDEARACLPPGEPLVAALIEERGGRPARAVEQAQAAIQGGDNGGWPRLYLGMALGQLGRLLEAELAWRDAQARFALAGDLRGLARASSNLAGALFQRGDLLGSADEAARAEAVDRRLGDRLGIAADLLHLHRIARARGDRETALSTLAEALALQRSLGNAQGEARVHQMAAVFHLEDGDPVAGLREAREGLMRIAEGHGQRSALHQLEGEARLRLGDREGARACFAAALAEAERCGRPRPRVEALCGLARLAAAEGDPQARVLLEEAQRDLDPADGGLMRVFEAARAQVKG